MKKIILLFILLSLLGCYSKKAVNQPAAPLFPILGGYNTNPTPVPNQNPNLTYDDYIKNPPKSAIGGVVLLDGEIPVPLSRVQLGLFQLQMGEWKELTRLNSEADGRFDFTRSLGEGSYEIRVFDSRYQGSLKVHLESSPKNDVIFLVQRVDKK